MLLVVYMMSKPTMPSTRTAKSSRKLGLKGTAVPVTRSSETVTCDVALFNCQSLMFHWYYYGAIGNPDGNNTVTPNHHHPALYAVHFGNRRAVNRILRQVNLPILALDAPDYYTSSLAFWAFVEKTMDNSKRPVYETEICTGHQQRHNAAPSCMFLTLA